MPGGQPTKFNEKVRRQAMVLAAKGFTDKEMAEVFDVKEQTINNWKRAHPKFFESLKESKLKADRLVERALYERACGYSYQEERICNTSGGPEVVKTTKHYPPDPVSMIFWLKNRQPDNWSDKKQVDLNIGLQGATDREIEEELIELAANQEAKGAQTPIIKGKDKA